MNDICPQCGNRRTRRVTVFIRRCPKCLIDFDLRNRNVPTAQNSFYIFNHQGKADRIVGALRQHEYNQSLSQNNFRGVRFVLSDYAAWGRQKRLQKIARQGVRHFFIYPHSARPNVISDMEPEWEGVTAQFVTTPEHIEILRTYNYPKPLHAVGWMLCTQKPFQPREQAKEILFAPIHPRCDETDKRVNRQAFSILERMARARRDQFDCALHRQTCKAAGL